MCNTSHTFKRFLLFVLLAVGCFVPAWAQTGMVVYEGEKSDLSVVPYPGETYDWTLYKDPTVNFATAQGDVTPNEAVFVGASDKAAVTVLWKKAGTYFFKVVAHKPYIKASCETMNLKIGMVTVLKQQRPDEKFISICQGQTDILNIPITPEMGEGPFSVTYSDGAKQITLTGITDNRKIIVRPDKTTTYILIEIKDEVTGKVLLAEKQVLKVITVNPVPVVSLSANDTMYIYKPVLFNVANKNDSIYLWHDGSVAPTFTATKEGEIFVTVTNKFGCKAGDTLFIRSCSYNIGLPTAFTPNGDKLNDTYKPVFVSDRDRPKRYRLEIYNKWGQRLFTTNNFDEGWDGTFNGAPCPMGTYTFSLEFEGVPYQPCNSTVPLLGTFTLLR